MGQQWPATGTGALATADLGGTACETHHRATDNPQIGEQLYQRSSHTFAKVLGPTTDSQPEDLATGLRTSSLWRPWLWRPVGFDYRSQAWGNRLLESPNKTLYAPGPRRMEQWPHKRLSQTHLWVSRSLPWRPGSTVACHGIRGTEYNNPFEGSHHYSSCGREHSPTHQQKIGLKIYWAWPCPSEQDPDSPKASPSHQEASTSLCPPSEGRQNGNHNYRKLTRLITWNLETSQKSELITSLQTYWVKPWG